MSLSGDLFFQHINHTKKRYLLVGVCAALPLSAAHAQDTRYSNKASAVPADVVDAGASSSEKSESVIVTGTHATNRKARDSTSPITVVSATTLRRSGQLNLADAITRVDPSITMATLPTETGALTSAIRMRGLNPNEVLVLVDGKRRHTTANLTAAAGPQQGSTAVDLNMIPANAIDHIEILRDGAAAMYGSDAIAGVVNIITKKTDHGLDASAQTGANAYNGDGWQYSVGIDGGMKLGRDGFLHLSGQVYHTDHFINSSKSVWSHQWTPGSSWAPTSDKSLSTPEETRGNLALEWAKPITEGIESYGLITYAHRHAEAIEHYRLPTVAPTAFPAGFSPLEIIDEDDYQANIGLRGKNLLGFDWDISTLYGEDNDRIDNKDTFNSGYYKKYGYSPTKVRASNFTLSQWTSNLDLRRNFSIAHAVPVTLAMGAEHRLEMYGIRAGDLASYSEGGMASSTALSPYNAGHWDRNVWAGYIDGDFHPLKHWDLDFAGRFEHYTDFGNTENGKVSTRYDFTKRIAIRGTISNGFRAPSLAEEHFSNLGVTPTGASGLLSTTSEAGRSIGAQHLKPERSTNVEGGIILEPIDGFHLSADVYQINIRDRIIGSGFVNGQTAYDAIALTGMELPTGGNVNLNNIKANYMANAASTRTQGLDLQADYLLHLHQYGNLTLSMMLNLNRTRLHHVNTNAYGNPLVSAQTIGYLTTASPRSKIVLNAFWSNGVWDVNVRQTRYGQTTSLLTYQDLAPAAVRYSTSQFSEFSNTPVWMTDLEVGYRFNRHWHASIGANNIFNQRPRHVPAQNNYLGTRPYDQVASSLPIYGAYYYGRVNASF
ncbi:TonB-dependent receptor plug domain-containing protein [Acetobacter cibinongensis]|uniref:TonB-dependent receptor plug domain-containing protein n=1 Tax=Acetobacter cibinongensis TaxID=146475 RepID=UPI000A397613